MESSSSKMSHAPKSNEREEYRSDSEIDNKLKEIPYVDRLLEIKGVGIKTVVGFVAEVGGIGRFDDQIGRASCRERV